MLKLKNYFTFGLGPDEYTRISECESTKEIWDALQIAHEGTNQVKQSRIELLMRKYEPVSYTHLTLPTNREV